jgi:putative transposase
VGTSKHEGTFAVDRSNTRRCSEGFEIRFDNEVKKKVKFALDYCDREVVSLVATTKVNLDNLVGDLIIKTFE